MTDRAIAAGDGAAGAANGAGRGILALAGRKIGAIEPVILGASLGLGGLGLVAAGLGAFGWAPAFGGLAAGLLGGAHWAARRARRFGADLDLMRRVYDASSFGRLVVRSDGQTVYANAAFRDLCGTGHALQALQQVLSSGVGGGADGTYGRLMAEAERRGDARAEVMQRKADGETRWLEVSVHRVAGPEGFVSWGVGDVTARHEMLQVIREEQEKLVAFVENAPIGVYSVDEKGRFQFVNHVLADWFGVSAGALTTSGRLLDHMRGEEGAPAFSPFVGGYDNAAGEVTFTGSDGRVRVASVTQRVILAAEGTGLVAHGVVRDLSREREWARALSDSEDRLKSFFAAAPIGLVLLDRFGRIEESNRAFRALIGPKAAEPIGRALVDLVADESRAGLDRHLRAAIDEGGREPRSR
ncbi:MAG: PAS domain S-box protein [Alphaproteobacteria bacterium]